MESVTSDRIRAEATANGLPDDVAEFWEEAAFRSGRAELNVNVFDEAEEFFDQAGNAVRQAEARDVFLRFGDSAFQVPNRLSELADIARGCAANERFSAVCLTFVDAETALSVVRVESQLTGPQLSAWLDGVESLPRSSRQLVEVVGAAVDDNGLSVGVRVAANASSDMASARTIAANLPDVE